MKRIWILIIILAAVLFYFLTPASWVEYKSVPGNYKILFPGHPQESEHFVETGADSKIHVARYNRDKLKGNDDDYSTDYSVMYTDYSAAPGSTITDEGTEGVFGNVVNNMVSAAPGLLISKEKIAFKGYKGLSLKMDRDGKGINYTRMYMIGKRFYMLQVFCKTSESKTADVDKFFSSFDLISE